MMRRWAFVADLKICLWAQQSFCTSLDAGRGGMDATLTGDGCERGRENVFSGEVD
jgi:hypothetical protein